MIARFKRYQFLFEELVKRDFKMKYKRTVLGMAWSLISPLLTLLIMRLVFTQFFGRSTPPPTTPLTFFAAIWFFHTSMSLHLKG